MTTQSKSNNLDYVIDAKFGFHRLFVFSLKNGDNDSTRNYVEKY